VDQTLLLERARRLVALCAEALRAGADPARWAEMEAALQGALAGRTKALAALTVFADEPEEPGSRKRLAGHLAVWAQADPAALAALLARWQTPPEPSQSSGNSQTLVGGQSIGVNIVGNVYGGLSVPSINLGPTTNVDTGGGAYAGRDLDKSQRFEIGGGAFGSVTSGAVEGAAARGRALADVLLVTVTDGETRAVFEALLAQTGQTPAQQYLGDKTYYDLGRVGGARVWLVRSEMGAVVPGGAFATVYGAIGAVRPAAIVMVGIAFGTDERRQSVGDVLVARQIQLYEPQRVGTRDGEPRVIPRGDRATASPRLIDRCRDGALHWSAGGAEVRFGLVLSGEKLLDHRASVEQLLAREPEAIGGEMEGAGLYVAATQHRVDWILVKAICDWADGHKSDVKAARQTLAARNAASFVLSTLARGGFAS
jgi:nucleoside phosphorylase